MLATPNVSRAQTVMLRFRSTWPQRDIFHEFAQDYVSRVNSMAGGRMRLELLAAGAVVGAFQLLDAVSSGTLDGGHGVSACWFGDANQFLGWFYYGGGEALHKDLLGDILKVNAVGFLTGPMPHPSVAPTVLVENLPRQGEAPLRLAGGLPGGRCWRWYSVPPWRRRSGRTSRPPSGRLAGSGPVLPEPRAGAPRVLPAGHIAARGAGDAAHEKSSTNRYRLDE